MIRFRTLLMLGLLCGMMLTSCEKEEKKTAGQIPPINVPPPAPAAETLIAKSWKVNKMDIKNELVPPSVVAAAFFTFYKDGRYEINLGMPERGTWKLSPDKKILITIMEGTDQEKHMDILRLSEQELILSNGGGPTPIRFELRPM